MHNSDYREKDVITEQLSNYISNNKLSRNTVINIRKLLRAKGTADDINFWLKFISLCKPEERSIDFNIDDSSLKDLVEKSKTKYISLTIDGGNEDCCTNIANTLERMKKIYGEIFFHTISTSPSIDDNNFWLNYMGYDADDDLMDTVDNIIAGGRCFKANLRLDEGYFWSKYHTNHVFSSIAEPIRKQSEPVFFPDSAKITLACNLYHNCDWASDEDVIYLENARYSSDDETITAREILFDFPGVSDEFLPCKIDSAEKLPAYNLTTFALLVAKNKDFFDKQDNDQVKFINEFCPKLVIICEKILLDNLEKSSIIKQALNSSNYILQSREIDYNFNSNDATKLMSFNEIGLFEPKDVCNLKELLEGIFGLNNSAGVGLRDDYTKYIDQFNTLLLYFKNSNSQDFKEFLKQYDTQDNFDNLLTDIYVDTKRPSSFYAPIAKLLKHIAKDETNAITASRIINELCAKDNLEYRNQRLNTIFGLPPKEWNAQLKIFATDPSLDDAKRDLLFKQLIRADDQKLTNPSEKFLNELKFCKGPSSTEIELTDVENLDITRTASSSR